MKRHRQPGQPAAEIQQKPSRREFLKQSTVAVAAGSIAGAMASARMVHAGEDNTLKVGLIGCGGRGSGAAVNAMHADKNAKLTAMADVFPDQLQHSREVLSRQLGDQYGVDDMQAFSGFDGYLNVLKTDVDVVLLCTPPHFRPQHLAAAIEAGKHVFCEKPVAVDGPGVRSVLATCELAAQKGLNVVSGLCWRYDYGVRETMKRIQDGAIGELVAVQENYLAGTLWQRDRQPEWSEMEHQLRNWLYYTWLSGDHIVEQHVHSLDKAMWLMGDNPPISCTGLGGRQVRTDPKFGHIYDHFAVCYDWENGFKAFAYTRQMAGCKGDVDDYVLGTTGRAALLKNAIDPKQGDKWRYRGPKPSMYDVEHQELFANIRSGGPAINNGKYMCYSTLMAIMGREACYTGQEITWEQAMESETRLGPKEYAWGDLPVPEVAVPGVTTFS